MIVLGLDSTAKVAAAGVYDGARVLAERRVESTLTQSELLLPLARAALADAGLSFEDVELYALTLGPGSFTGVRIGVGLVKGLVFDKETPCAGVSILEALAENLAPFEGICAPVLDARRDHVYNALFKWESGRLCRLCEDRVLPLDALMEELARDYAGLAVLFVGDGYDKAVLRAERASLPVTDVVPDKRLPSGAAIARLGYAAHLRGESVSGEALAPVYLRLPQAERERLERENKKTEDNG